MAAPILPEDLDRRLAAELVPVRPTPYTPDAGTRHTRPSDPAAPVTDEQAEHHRAVLLAALAPGRRRAA